MTNIYRSLLLVIAGASQKELARQIKYLKVENQILRSRLTKRLDVTPKERARLVKFACGLAARVLQQLVTIVHPVTLLRWVREDRRGKRRQPPAWRGRRQTPEQLRQLIRRMARENDWGYTKPHPHYAPLRFAKQLLRFAWAWSIQWDMGHRTSRGEFDGVA